MLWQFTLTHPEEILREAVACDFFGQVFLMEILSFAFSLENQLTSSFFCFVFFQGLCAFHIHSNKLLFGVRA